MIGTRQKALCLRDCETRGKHCRMSHLTPRTERERERETEEGNAGLNNWTSLLSSSSAAASMIGKMEKEGREEGKRGE